MLVPDIEVERDHYRDLWHQLVLEFYQPLLSWGRRISGNPFDAEDLVHETIYRVIRYPRDPGTLDHPLHYLRRIMRGVWLDKVRKEAARSMDSIDDPLKSEALENQLPTVEPEAFRNVESAELRDALEALAGPLTPREWDLLKMRLEGMTCEEIAELWSEHVRVITGEWNALKAKIKYRVRIKLRGNASDH